MQGKLDGYLSLVNAIQDQTHQRKGKQSGWCLKQKCKNEIITAISSYKTKLDDKFKEGIKMDKEYQNLREKVTDKEYKNIKTDYSLNEKGLMLYKNRLYVPNILEIQLLILNEVNKSLEIRVLPAPICVQPA